MDHFQYCVDLVGIDHVTFGPDALFGDHVGLAGEFANALGTASSDVALPPFPTVEYVEGMENPADAFSGVALCLVESGYSDEEVRQVLGGNALRVLGRIWPA